MIAWFHRGHNTERKKRKKEKKLLYRYNLKQNREQVIAPQKAGVQQQNIIRALVGAIEFLVQRDSKKARSPHNQQLKLIRAEKLKEINLPARAGKRMKKGEMWQQDCEKKGKIGDLLIQQQNLSNYGHHLEG